MRVGHLILRQLVLLLEVDYHFVLPADHLFVLVDLLLVELDLLVLLSGNVYQEVI